MANSLSLLVRLTLGGTLVVLTGACDTFQARSSEFSCEQDSECDAPRTCISGYCVLPGELLADAAPQWDANRPLTDASIPDAAPPDAMPDAGWHDANPATCVSLGLVDNFEDFVAFPNWLRDRESGVDVFEEGVLVILVEVLPSTPSSGGYVSTKKDYVLTNSSFLIEVPQMVDVDSKASAFMVLEKDASNNLVFEQKSGDFIITEQVAGVSRVLVSEPYSPTQHRWWRVIDYQGIYRVQTSTNGVVWVEKAFATTPSFFDAVEVQLTMRSLSTGVIPGALVFDNAGGGDAVEACPQ